MRVTVVCGMCPPAAAPEGMHAAMLCDYLARAGCTVTLLTRQIERPQVEPTFELRAVMRDWGWRDAGLLKRELARSRPDAVVLFYIGWLYGRHPMITFLPTVCRRLTPPPRVMVKFTNTGGAEPARRLTRWGRKLAEWRAGGRGVHWRYGTLLRDADSVVAFCAQHLAKLLEFHPAAAERGAVIPAPPLLRPVEDPDGSVRRRTREKLGARDDEFIVAYFGYIYPEKGVETVLAAAATARARIPGLRLLMIGGVPDAASMRDRDYPDRMKALTKELEIADRVSWTGYVDDPTASSYLHAADACVLPFVQGVQLNNSSMAVVTSHGLPVITTRGPAIEPEFVDRRTALLVPPGDAPAMSAAIVELATDTGLRESLRAGAAEFARGRSSWESVVAETLQLLRGAGPSPRPEPAPAAAAVVSR
jgi:polysaccharide biosynthesis protein PslF